MDKPMFFQNPDFREYLRLLRDLHILIREGADETPSADALRQQMDSPGERLSSAEIAWVSGISADFYSWSDPPAEPAPISTAAGQAAVATALAAREVQDFPRALELLREHRSEIEPAKLASVRGAIWRDLGEPEIAGLFFQQAVALDKTNPTYLELLQTTQSQISG